MKFVAMDHDKEEVTHSGCIIPLNSCSQSLDKKRYDTARELVLKLHKI